MEEYGGVIIAVVGLVVGGLFIWMGLPTVLAFFNSF